MYLVNEVETIRSIFVLRWSRKLSALQRALPVAESAKAQQPHQEWRLGGRGRERRPGAPGLRRQRQDADGGRQGAAPEATGEEG